MEEVQRGELSPVFFGSALTNFGVEPFLEEFLRMTPSPLPRVADCGEIDTFSPDFSAFVFKIQANMNKAHRDRLAFMRICSGKFERDAEYYHVQGNKKMRLSQPQQLMASEREIVDEAYAGDIIGVFDPGIFSIGDTICTPGHRFQFGGIPTFAPEHFSRVSPKDSMKRKQFIKGTEQIAQEGAIQIFKLPNSGMEEVIVGVVGTLQFDVFQYRMKGEYGVDLRMEGGAPGGLQGKKPSRLRVQLVDRLHDQAQSGFETLRDGAELVRYVGRCGHRPLRSHLTSRVCRGRCPHRPICGVR